MPIIKTKLYVNGNSGIPPIVNLKQFDKTSDANGKQLQFTLYDGATTYSIPTGATVTVRGTKPDLTGYEYPCTFSGNVVTVNVQEQMTVCAGRHDAEIRIEKDGNILGTASLTMNVEKSALASDVAMSKTYLPLIEQAGQNVNDIKTFYEATKEMYEKLSQMSYTYKTEGMSQLELETTARYETARTGKIFATKHSKFSVNTSPMGTKIEDSAGLKCTPSTDKVVGQDDFIQYLPFQWEHVNYVRDDDDGFARPIAVEGRPNYKTSGAVDVGTMSATFWWKRVEDETSYTIYMSDMPHPELGLVPWCEAVKADGTVHPYYIGSSYYSGTASDGLLRSQPNLSPAYNQSHNSQITDYQKKGKGYWGCGTEYVLHGLIFSEIKYGTANIQQYAQGCTGYSFQTKCALAETGVTRVLSKSAWACDVGNTVSVGVANSSGSIDRGVTDMNSKANRVRVKSMETVTIDGTTYYAINLDTTTKFDTDTNTYVSSMPCYAGETDAVVDHYDGSNVSYTNARHTFRLHGREYLAGQYFVSANAGLKMVDKNWHVMCASKGTKHNTGLTGYSDIGYVVYNSGADYWIGEWDCNQAYGQAFPSAIGKSNSLGVGDMCYAGGANIVEGTTREYLFGGYLWGRSGAGLLYVGCWDGLGGGAWDIASRD